MYLLLSNFCVGVTCEYQTNFMLDGRHEALLPKDMSTRTVHEQTFRIWHKHGSVIVIANSDTDKVRREHVAILVPLFAWCNAFLFRQMA